MPPTSPRARPTLALLSSLVLALGSAPLARAQTQGPVSPPPRDEPPAPKPERLPATIVTATRLDQEVFDVPYTAAVLDSERLQVEEMRRSTPDAVTEIPQVMGQKTAFGQGSPFLRGFTGYQTLFLIDGIRLNNSAFRSGPNQYWATVDPFSYEKLEVVLGPGSVLYGSDAVGGVVNALTNRRRSYEPGVHADGRLFFRWSQAESSFLGRAEGSANVGDRVGLFAGYSTKDFGDLRAGGGTGTQHETGYDERDADARLDLKLNDQWKFTGAFQFVRQMDVPRTHTTIFAESFQGTAVGTELQRDHDQSRSLLYGRFERADAPDAIDRELFTLSWHRQSESRDRIRTGGRRDFQSFEVDTPGIQAQVTRETCFGILTGGFEYTHDFVESERVSIAGGTATTEVQGPLGDNAGYDLAGLYLQAQIPVGDFEIVPGVRGTWAHASAGQVDNPAVPGAGVGIPGNVIGISDSWVEPTGSLRALWHVTPDWNVFAGVSQAFRAPSLSDLTSFDETSAAEFPSPGLRPERFLQEEIGVKARGDGWTFETSYWETQISGAIVPSPNGAFSGATPIVVKSNVGDGSIHGANAQGSLELLDGLTSFGWVSWQEGSIDQIAFPAGGTPFETRAPVSRAMPLSAMAGLRYRDPHYDWFAELVVRGATRQDKLSFKDRTDTQRIPPGGTPGWVAVDLRGGLLVTDNVRLTAALENVANENYRIHGSGLNEPGLNFIIGVDIRF